MVLPATFALLAAAHADRPEAILVPVVRTTDGLRRGHPVVFPRWAFADLEGPLADADGARGVVRARTDRVVELPVEDPGITVDIDSQQGYLSMWRADPRLSSGSR